MTSVSAGHIILTPTQPEGSGRPQRESNPEPPNQESRALPTGHYFEGNCNPQFSVISGSLREKVIVVFFFVIFLLRVDCELCHPGNNYGFPIICLSILEIPSINELNILGQRLMNV